MLSLDAVEFSFYLVETFALPFAIVVFAVERRKQRQIEEEELYQRLSDEYTNFLKLVLDNADLQLLRRQGPIREITEEQMERKFALFGILVSIFERAYILVYEERMTKQTRRLWSSWEDYMREWCQRADFRAILPGLLDGEDPEFRACIERIAAAAAAAAGPTGPRPGSPVPSAPRAGGEASGRPHLRTPVDAAPAPAGPGAGPPAKWVETPIGTPAG